MIQVSFDYTYADKVICLLYYNGREFQGSCARTIKGAEMVALADAAIAAAKSIR